MAELEGGSEKYGGRHQPVMIASWWEEHLLFVDLWGDDTVSLLLFADLVFTEAPAVLARFGTFRHLEESKIGHAALKVGRSGCIWLGWSWRPVCLQDFEQL